MFFDLGASPVYYMRDGEATDVNVFSEVANLLMMAGWTGDATQLVGDIYRSLLRSEATIMVRGEAYVYVARAADRVGMEQLGSEALSQAITAARSEEMGWYGAEVALQIADTLAARPGKSDNDAKLLRQALAAAEPAIALAPEESTRSKLYHSLATHWILQGELARARILAEKASGRVDVMTAYRAILERVIADRRKAAPAATGH